MELQDNNNKDLESGRTNSPFSRGQALAGLIIVIVGVLLLAKQVGVEFPYWFFSWPMMLIAIGVFVGARHSFRNPGWMIPVAIGTVFLIERIAPDVMIREYVWPIIIISVGLFMIFRPRGRHRGEWRILNKRKEPFGDALSDNSFESVMIFGSDKKQIISKDFKGGESVCVLGGVEINLTQADVTDTAVIEIVQLFGGTKIIVPPHWKIQTNELVCVFGALEDKRQINGSVVDPTKVLILKGTCIFGGIDLRSF